VNAAGTSGNSNTITATTSAPPASQAFTLVLFPDTQNYTAQINGGTMAMYTAPDAVVRGQPREPQHRRSLIDAFHSGIWRTDHPTAQEQPHHSASLIIVKKGFHEFFRFERTAFWILSGP
jgi:hypothetical protein